MGLEDNTHPALAELLEDFIMRNDLANHELKLSLLRGVWQKNRTTGGTTLGHHHGRIVAA